MLLGSWLDHNQQLSGSVHSHLYTLTQLQNLNLDNYRSNYRTPENTNSTGRLSGTLPDGLAKLSMLCGL